MVMLQLECKKLYASLESSFTALYGVAMYGVFTKALSPKMRKLGFMNPAVSNLQNNGEDEKDKWSEVDAGCFRSI
jgi:hypothetical protein